MPFVAKTPATMLAEMQNAVIANTNKLKSFGSNTIAGAELQAFLAQEMFLQRFALQIQIQQHLSTATGADLTSWAADFYLSPPRLLAVAPTGQATFTLPSAPLSTVYVPVGGIIKTSALPPAQPTKYVVGVDTTNPAFVQAVNNGLGGYAITNPSTSVSFPITGVFPSTNLTSGTALNVYAGALTVIESTNFPAGGTVTNAANIFNGVDQEPDPNLRVRLGNWISGVMGSSKGNGAGLKAVVASSLNGLTFTYNDLLDGSNAPANGKFTFNVDDGSGAISAANLTLITNNVLAAKAGGITPVVQAPTNTNLTFACTGTNVYATYSPTDVRTRLQQAIITYCNSNGVGGYNPATGIASGKITYAGLQAAVAALIGNATPAQGLIGYGALTMNGGTADIAIDNYHLARTVAGSVTVS